MLSTGFNLIYHYPADSGLSSSTSSRFTLVDRQGNIIVGEELQLLLYNGGTVCDDSFTMTAAHAICKDMGYVEAIEWYNGKDLGEDDIRSHYTINMRGVRCNTADWKNGCSYVEGEIMNCAHDEDVFLSCASDPNRRGNHLQII